MIKKLFVKPSTLLAKFFSCFSRILIPCSYFFSLGCILVLTSCSSTPFSGSTFFSGSSTSSQPIATSNVDIRGFPNSPSFWQGSPTVVWNKLQQLPPASLQNGLAQTNDSTSHAWIKLAIISKQYSTQTPTLVNQLLTWRAENPNHPGNALLPSETTLSSLQNTAPPHHFALLLPLQGPLASSGQTVRDGFLSSYYSMQKVNKVKQTISFYDTSQNSDVSALYQKAIAEGADRVIGPLTKENVQSLASYGSFPVPTLALNYTNSSLPSNFYEFGLSHEDETQQVADKVWQAGLKRAIIIAPQNSRTQRIVNDIESRWQSLGGQIVDSYYFSPQTNLTQGIANLLHVDPNANLNNKENNKTELAKQRRQDFDVIFLLAPPASARQIVPLLKYYYANNVPIYSTSVIFGGAPSAQDSDLSGVTFIDTPWTLQNKGGNRLYAVGRDAYLLSNGLTRITLLPNFPLYGDTGALTLSSQKIYRRLPWARMHDRSS